jgi:hypothetical protein
MTLINKHSKQSQEGPKAKMRALMSQSASIEKADMEANTNKREILDIVNKLLRIKSSG